MKPLLYDLEHTQPFYHGTQAVGILLKPRCAVVVVFVSVRFLIIH